MIAGSYDSFDGYKQRRRFANLDGLRFLCITAVIWHHAGIPMADEVKVLSRGFLGVDFFFVLSGYLITTLLLREEERKGEVSFRGFYWRRFLRIIPVYFLVVTLATVYFGLVQGDGEVIDRAPYYYLFLSNFLDSHTPLLQPTWSLSVEEQYYIFWPLVLVFVPRRWLVPVATGFVALNVLAQSGLFGLFGGSPPSGAYATLGFPPYSAILLGAISATLLHRRESYQALAKLFGRPIMPLVLLVGLAVMFAVFPKVLGAYHDLAIHLAMAGFIIAIVTCEKNAASPFLTLPPIVRIGEISYGIYLYHLIGLHVATIISGQLFGGYQPWFGLAGMYLITIVIAEVSFRTFEALFRSLRSRPPFFIAPTTKVGSSAS